MVVAMSGSRNPIPSFLGLENNQALSLPTRIATRVTRLVHPKIIFDFDAQKGAMLRTRISIRNSSGTPGTDFIDAISPPR